MSGLFIELYLDEDVDVLLADLLKARGFDVLTTLEAQRLGATDAEQLAFATSVQRTLLTHNRVHFEQLIEAHFVAGLSHPGVIIAVRRDVYELTRRMLIILNNVAADEMRDQVRYI
jgi:hypothetical protein